MLQHTLDFVANDFTFGDELFVFLLNLQQTRIVFAQMPQLIVFGRSLLFQGFNPALKAITLLAQLCQNSSILVIRACNTSRASIPCTAMVVSPFLPTELCTKSLA